MGERLWNLGMICRRANGWGGDVFRDDDVVKGSLNAVQGIVVVCDF